MKYVNSPIFEKLSLLDSYDSSPRGNRWVDFWALNKVKDDVILDSDFRIPFLSSVRIPIIDNMEHILHNNSIEYRILSRMIYRMYLQGEFL